jgi:hypothetical protein
MSDIVLTDASRIAMGGDEFIPLIRALAEIADQVETCSRHLDVKFIAENELRRRLSDIVEAVGALPNLVQNLEIKTHAVAELYLDLNRNNLALAHDLPIHSVDGSTTAREWVALFSTTVVGEGLIAPAWLKSLGSDTSDKRE